MSGSGVTVTLGGVLVLSTILTAAFQRPHTIVGGMPVPPCCQSPDLLSPSFRERSVRNSAGHNGRPPPADTSLPAIGPLATISPTNGSLTHVGVKGGGVMANLVVSFVPFLCLITTILTPRVSAC